MDILKVEGVNKSFGGLRALNEVNFSVEEGIVHAIIGPNGAGKSTFLNCMISGLPESCLCTKPSYKYLQHWSSPMGLSTLLKCICWTMR